MSEHVLVSLSVDDTDPATPIWTLTSGSATQTVSTEEAVQAAAKIDEVTGGNGARLAVRTVQRGAINAAVAALEAQLNGVEAEIVALEGAGDDQSSEAPAPAPVPISSARRRSKATAPAAPTAPSPLPPAPAPQPDPVGEDEHDEPAQEPLSPTDEEIPPAEPPMEDDEF